MTDVSESKHHAEIASDREAFGLFLTGLRLHAPRKVKQKEILAHLPGWTAPSYSRLEQGLIAPPFEQLESLYEAFLQIGIKLSPVLRQQFLNLARRRIALQKTYKYLHSDEEWAELGFRLAELDGWSSVSMSAVPPSLTPVQLMETTHLLGRTQWRESLIDMVIKQSSQRKKLVVLRGPMGIGKSSELHRLAATLLCHEQASNVSSSTSNRRVIFCDLGPAHSATDMKTIAHDQEAEAAIAVLLGTLLTDFGLDFPDIPSRSIEERMRVVFEQFEREPHAVTILVDNGEHVFTHQGILHPCWHRFLAAFLRRRHHVTLVVATRQWSGWYGGDYLFVEELNVPPLSMEQGVFFLQQLGLDAVPISLLQQVYTLVGGIPLCLEWVAALVRQQPWSDDKWIPPFPDAFSTSDDLDSEGQTTPVVSTHTRDMIRAVERMLAEPRVFSGSESYVLAPLLDRVIAHQRLSAEALHLLETLSVASLPLAQSALEIICPQGPYPIHELRRASLLAAYPDRVQLLPMVAAAILRHLSPETLDERETLLIRAYTAWLEQGIVHERERGMVITALATLLLNRRRLLEAAEWLIRYGWLSFNMGYAPQLARLAQKIMQDVNWRTDEEHLCGGQLLQYYLLPYLGQTVIMQEQLGAYQGILERVVDKKVMLQPPTEMYIIRHLMVHQMSQHRFQEAEVLLDACRRRLAIQQAVDTDLQASLLEKRAMLYGTWCEFAEGRGEKEDARRLREQAIALYRQCSELLSTDEAASSLKTSIMKKRQARCLNDLGFHLNRIGKYGQARVVLEQSLVLKEQGFVEPGSLAPSYDEMAQTLAGLGQFCEALSLNERAIREIERLAQSGHTPSQEEVWIYRVNRGRLLLQCGRVDEAETMLQEALSHIHPRRRMFHMFAHHALDEIQQGRAVSQGGHYQLDWRWIGKYREIAAFDSLWWLSPCGPLTGDEEREWQAWQSRSVDELERRQRLQAIVLQARHRELTAAHAEQREPRFAYPVIPIDDVLARLAMLEELNEAIAQHEPNALVRRFYAAAIEEQRWFLNMIKATHEGNNQAFMESNQHLHPAPTEDEMRYTLSRVAHIIQKGCQQAETQELAHQVSKLLQTCLLVPSDFEAMLEDEGTFKTANTVSINTTASNGSASSRQFAPHIVQHFLETVLQDCGYDQWSVTLDASAQAARIEQGLRTLIIPAIPCTVAQVRSYLVHELGGHVARAVAGERSPLGLLGIGTKQNLVTEEGLALFLEQRTADIQGIPYDESRLWLGTLATGMASGVLTLPQTFRRSLAFFELFLLLYRLLRHSDQDMQAAQKRAHDLALLRCLRTYRGVPDLTEAGMCSTKDAVYLRGYHLIEHAFAKNEAILDRLTVGVVAIEDLPDLDELHLTAPAYPPARVALDPSLETRLIAFEQGHIGKEVS